jgi:hypothetical protein
VGVPRYARQVGEGAYEEGGVRALPRGQAALGRYLDSREFWETFRGEGVVRLERGGEECMYAVLCLTLAVIASEFTTPCRFQPPKVKYNPRIPNPNSFRPV